MSFRLQKAYDKLVFEVTNTDIPVTVASCSCRSGSL